MKLLRLSILLTAAALLIASMHGCTAESINPPGKSNEKPGDDDDDDNRNPDCDLLTLHLDKSLNGLPSDVVFTIDQSRKTAAGTLLTWIGKGAPEMLIPTFTFKGAEVSVDDVIVEPGVSQVSFAKEFKLVVTAENEDIKTYRVSLNCPQINTEIPVLRLQPDSPINSKDVYVKTKLDMYDNASMWEADWSASDEKIDVRGRGNSTWNDPDKKPYRLKFPKKISPLELNHAEEKNWVLIACDSDKSFMRNEMAFAFSRILFDPSENHHDPKAVLFTPCSRFVNVYMNDKYHGLYQMSDHMQQGDGRIAVDKLTADDGDNTSMITGGYILETDIHQNNGPDRFNSRYGIQINRKYPKDDDYHQSQYDYIADFISNKVEATLYADNFKHPTEGWRKYIDEKTAADFLILKEFAGDADGYTSTYFYKRRGVDKIFFGPGWDFDKGWNNESRIDNSDPVNNLMIYVGFGMPGCSREHWFQRLWQDESFRTTVKTRWTSKREALIAAATRVLDEKPAAMPNAVKANYMIWDYHKQQIDGAKPPAATYELEIERLRSFIYARAEVLDGKLK